MRELPEMPKQKTVSAAKKKFKVSGAGKLLRRHAMKSHNLEHKSSKRRRAFRKDNPVADGDDRNVRKQLGIG
jgi:large subunit ribosomal protein L35